MEENIEFEKKYNYLIANGKYYEWKSKDGKPILEIVDKKKVEERIQKAKEIARKIKYGLDAETVLTEIIMQFTDKDFKKLYELVNSKKRKYKAKTRTDHCVDMKVGKMIIPLVD